ncbi:MAG: hypothetical protein WBD25_00525 [Terriglobales bacterium]
MKNIVIGTLLVLGVSGAAAAQSLGDYARAIRKNKPEPSATTRHFDNDNLPTDQTLSVVGPPPSANANSASAANASASDPAAAAAERQKTADAWKDKLAKQQEKINSLNHELDLDQRENRLRAASYYADAGSRLRNAAATDKQDTDYKSDVDAKQKAIEAAQQELNEMQEQARKDGIVEKEKDSDGSSNNNNDSGNDKNKAPDHE